MEVNSSEPTQSVNTSPEFGSNPVPKVDNNCCDYNNTVFIKALVAILLGSVLVNLWIRVVNNFAYNTLKLNSETTRWPLVVALVATAILILYIAIFLDEDTKNQVKRTLTGVAFGNAASNVSSTGLNVDTSDYNIQDAADT